MALARDIKAKIDKKQVRTSWTRMDSCWAVLIFSASPLTLFLCVTGGQQPSGEQSRSQDHRSAQEKQFLPLHAAVKRLERGHPPSP